MAISDELTLLASTKASIKNSINAKGGNITDSTPFADYATAITNLPSGGDNSTLIDLIERDITSINIPSGTTRIGNSAFYGASSITSVTIPSGVTSIGDSSFYLCIGLTSVNIPNTVTSIGDYAFYLCRVLTSIDIPNSVTTIGNNAFCNCSGMISLKIGTGVNRIDENAFYSCSGLTSITCLATTPPLLPAGTGFNNTGSCPIYVPAASVQAYKAATNWSTYASRIFAIEDAITFTPTNGDPAISVKNYELASANYVQSSDVPATIKNGAGALEICEGVTRIGQFAFQSGTSLTSVTLPSTLTRIDEAVFYGCTSLTSVTVNATTPPTMYGAVFGQTNNCPIYVPVESVDAYKAANNWSSYASRIQAIPSE